jgi:hypothetical protein
MSSARPVCKSANCQTLIRFADAPIGAEASEYDRQSERTALLEARFTETLFEIHVESMMRLLWFLHHHSL